MKLFKTTNKKTWYTFSGSCEPVGKKKLQKITASKMENNRTYKGFNFFEKTDQDVLVYLTSGEFNISGFRCKHLKKRFKNYSAFKISRILKRLRVIGLIKKIGTTYKYYITTLGNEAIINGFET